MKKPETPKTDQLATMPAGMARDLFAQINSRALQAESGQLQAFEAHAEVGKDAARVELARKAGHAELARYRELEQTQPTMAAIFREANAFTLAQQERAIAALEAPQDNGPEAA